MSLHASLKDSSMISTLTWMKVIVFLLFSAHASLVPFLSVALRGLGWSISQTGVLVSSSKLFSLFTTPIVAARVNRSQTLNPVVALATLSGCISILLGIFGAKFTFSAFFLMFSIFAIVSSPKQTIIDNLIVRACGPSNYGAVRLWGSVSWGMSGFLVGGGLYAFEYEVGCFLFVFHGMALLVLALTTLKFDTNSIEIHESEAGDEVVTQSVFPPLSLMPPLLLLFCFGVLEFSVDMVYFPYLRRIGASPMLLSSLVAVVAVAEVFGFALTSWLHSRVSSSGIISLGGLAFSVKLLGFACGGTSWILVVFQILHGIYFPLMWTASIHLLKELLESGGHHKTDMMVWMWIAHSGLPPVVGGVLSAEVEQYLGPQGVLRLCAGGGAVIITLYFVASR